MKIFGIKMGSNKQSSAEEKDLQTSSSTVDIPDDPAASPVDLLESPEKRNSKTDKKNKKKSGGGDIDEMGASLKRVSRSDRKKSKDEMDGSSKRHFRRTKSTDASTEWKRPSNKKGDIIPTSQEVNDLMKDMDPDQVMKVLKKFADEDSTDLVGKECIKAMKRAEQVKSPMRKNSSGNQRVRRTRTGAPPAVGTSGGGGSGGGAGFRRCQTEAATARRSPTRTKSKDAAAIPAEI